MENLWNPDAAGAIPDDALALGVRLAELIERAGVAPAGGCSVSVKSTGHDFFGDPVELCCVSRCDSDFAALDRDDLVPLRRQTLVALSECETLSDADWLAQVRAARLVADGPDPATDALLHAWLPSRYVAIVDAGAVLALTNRPDGEAEVRRVFGERVRLVPYALPGFPLSKVVQRSVRAKDLSDVDGLILAGLGIVTFCDDAQGAYERLVELVSLAEQAVPVRPATRATAPAEDLPRLAELRAAVAAASGHAVVATYDASPGAVAYSGRADIDDLATRGSLTPRQPLYAAVLDDDVSAGMSRYAAQHAGRSDRPGRATAAAGPDFVVWRDRGVVSFGRSPEAAQRCADRARHTYETVQRVEAQSTWMPVAESEVFAAECRQLPEPEAASTRPHQGKVAVVTGAAAGIGFASARALAEAGATVIGLDLHPDVVGSMREIGALGLVADLTSDEQIITALGVVILNYGGLDILVSNAGIFTAGSRLEDLEPDDWDRSLAVNLTSHQRLLKRAIPFLEHGVEAAVVIMGSRNVNAPGAGAASYSCAKAALTQLCRVAALELAPRGVRVNIVHPDAVFDTKLWTPEALQRSADRYGMTVEEYKSRNLMKTEILSANVGMMVSVVAGAPFAKTTGAQIPVDGGNDRII